jgi:serine/threonine protein kinase
MRPMEGCVVEDDLLELVRGRRPLGDTPSIEAHLADCPACSALVAMLLSAPKSSEPSLRRDMAGRSLGPYRLDVLIGAGAMGEVYRAWDERLTRHVAVKVVSPRIAGSPEQVRRLEAEGRAAAAIGHPNIVTVYDVGNADGVPFIVSELIDGESLRSRIDRGAIPRRAALRFGLDLARGLSWPSSPRTGAFSWCSPTPRAR